MSEFKGFVIKNSSGAIVFECSRHKEARTKCEQLNLTGKDKFTIEESWNGRPTSVIMRTIAID